VVSAASQRGETGRRRRRHGREARRVCVSETRWTARGRHQGFSHRSPNRGCPVTANSPRAALEKNQAIRNGFLWIFFVQLRIAVIT
jgi:hypothetical protein